MRTHTLHGPDAEMKPDEALNYALRIMNVALQYAEVPEGEPGMVSEFIDLAWGYVHHAREKLQNTGRDEAPEPPAPDDPPRLHVVDNEGA